MMHSRRWYLLAIFVAVVLGFSDVASAGPGRGAGDASVERGRSPGGLAFQLLGQDPVALRGADEGGERRPRGGRPEAIPVVLQGLPGPLSRLLEQFRDGRRFGGRVFRVAGGDGQTLLDFDKAFATILEVPQVGPDADPFEIRVTIDPGEVDLGPFAPEPVDRPPGASAFRAELELAAGSIDPATPIAAEQAQIRRPRGGRIQASNLRVAVASEDLPQFLELFTAGRRLSDVRLSYLRPGGGTALDITSATGRIVAVQPAFGDDGAVLEIELNEPAVEF